jgi:lipoyl(octanoyl) transferase
MNVTYWGTQSYETMLNHMQDFTRQRTDDTEDALWLLEHSPVYTQGQAGKSEHIINRNAIPIIQSDRGGQITYHGPGQLIAYVLLNLKKRHLNISALVFKLEEILILLLQYLSIEAHRIPRAPGVYVNNKKIASIGLRVRQGYSYHGIALNVAMDLTPFSDINPCGFSELSMTQIRDFVPTIKIKDVLPDFLHRFSATLCPNEPDLLSSIHYIDSGHL